MSLLRSRYSRLLPLPLVLIGWLMVSSVVSRAADRPEERWLHAFVLVHTGEQLADQDLWSLAMANYAAALHQFEGLAKEFPGFQPRLVGYRVQDLRTRLREAGESMTGGDHDLAMNYEEVIETARIGTKSRYHLDFATSYQHLIRAQWQLKDLLANAPEKVVAALEDQKKFIDEMTESSREWLMREPEGPLMVHDIEKDFAVAAKIEMGDLPSFRDIEPSASGMSSALFPDSLVAQVRGRWYR